MEQDLATLQVISETLKEDPQASQRTLAKKANMSLGMMNAILGRFVERGWIMLTNVNGRKLAYAVTAEGISELTERGRKFARRTFAIANNYNDIVYELIKKAKSNGKDKVILYGKSYISFLLVYICKEVGVDFFNVGVETEVDLSALCIVGELSDSQTQIKLKLEGCINIMDVLENSKINNTEKKYIAY